MTKHGSTTLGLQNPTPASYTQPVARIPPRRLTGPDNLDHLAALQPQVARNRVLLQDARQLRLLEAVAAQQRRLLLAAEHNVLGHEDVVRDVDQQVLLEEALDLRVLLGDGDDLARLRRQRLRRDEDAGLVILRRAERHELFDHADADRRLLRAELDEDGAGLGDGGRVRGCGGGRVLLDHGLRGARGEGHDFAAGGRGEG